MRCGRALRLASRSIDGGLEDAERAALDAHLHLCAGCQEAARRLGHAWELLVALPPPVPAPDDWTRLVARLDARTRWLPAWLEGPWALPRPVAAAALLALAALGAGGGVLASRAALRAPVGSFEGLAFAETLGELPWGSPAAALAGAMLDQPEPVR